jgi:hypothetical protein
MLQVSVTASSPAPMLRVARRHVPPRAVGAPAPPARHLGGNRPGVRGCARGSLGLLRASAAHPCNTHGTTPGISVVRLSSDFARNGRIPPRKDSDPGHLVPGALSPRRRPFLDRRSDLRLPPPIRTRRMPGSWPWPGTRLIHRQPVRCSAPPRTLSCPPPNVQAGRMPYRGVRVSRRHGGFTPCHLRQQSAHQPPPPTR